MAVTFVVEDGSGVSDATSYVTLAEFEQIWDNEGYDYSELTEDEIYRYLNKSTRYVDATYMSLFPGFPQYDDQALLWPRSGAFYYTGYEIDENLVPSEIKLAVCQAAYIMSTGIDLFATISSVGLVTKAREKVDVLETEYEYEGGTYSDRYPLIDDALYKITGGTLGLGYLKIISVAGESP